MMRCPFEPFSTKSDIWNRRRDRDELLLALERYADELKNSAVHKRQALIRKKRN